MPNIKTIKPAGGGDYTSLQAWEDVVDSYGDAAQWAECYSGGNLGAVNISGWTSTPSSTNYPRVYVAEGHGHKGSSSNGAYISTSDAPFVSTEEYTQLDGIRIESLKSANSAAVLNNTVSGSSGRDCKIENCYIHGKFTNGIFIGQNGGTGKTSTNYVANNIVVIDGTDNNTPVGIYAFGTDASLGVTNMFVYNNTVYVNNSGASPNIGIQFINISGCTLNITCENNVVFAHPTYATCYRQAAFHTGTKTFNNNISSDATSDDFGGSHNLVNRINPFTIFSSPTELNFNLHLTSSALNSGKTIEYITTDILGTKRPQSTQYDIGAIERPFVVPSRTLRFNIPDSVISLHEGMVDSLIEGPVGQLCELIYPSTKNSLCPNCIYSPRQKKSSSIYKTGGPVPFSKHTLCPWCGGSGKSSREITEEINLRAYWKQKDWLISGPVENPDGAVMVIGYMHDLPKLEKADRILINKDVSAYRRWLCERSGEAVPWGLSQDKYFAQMLQRVGGG